MGKKKIIKKKIAKRSENLAQAHSLFAQDNPLQDFMFNNGQKPESSKVDLSKYFIFFLNNLCSQAEKTNVVLELPFERQLNTFRIEQEKIIQELRGMKNTQRWLMAGLRRVRFSYY